MSDPRGSQMDNRPCVFYTQDPPLSVTTMDVGVTVSTSVRDRAQSSAFST